MVPPIEGFWGSDSGFLSIRNDDIPIEFEGQLFKTLAHAFAATLTPNRTEREEIAKLPTYTAVERCSVEIPDPEYKEYWDKSANSITVYLVAQKFGLLQNRPGPFLDKLSLAHQLVLTGERELIYTNHSHDQRWGRCACKDHNFTPGSTMGKGGVGLNRYGKALMAIRDNLQSRWLGDPTADTCDWCFTSRNGTLTPATKAIYCFIEDKICRTPVCDRHASTTSKNLKRMATKRRLWQVPVGDNSSSSVVTCASSWHAPKSTGSAKPTVVTSCSTAGDSTSWSVLYIHPDGVNEEFEVTA